MVAGRLALKWHLYSQHSVLAYVVCLRTLLWTVYDKSPRAAFPCTALFREGAAVGCFALSDSQ